MPINIRNTTEANSAAILAKLNGTLGVSGSFTPSGNQRVNAQANDFLTGSIVDLLTLLTLAGTNADANTVATLFGRLTKIRDLLASTLTVTGTVNTLHGSVVDATNSSATPLAANSVFTGTLQSSLNYSALSVEVFADQTAAAGGLSVQQSTDGTNWDIKDTFNVVANTAFQTTVNLIGQSYKVVYTNGGTNQGAFRLQTVKQTSENVLPRTLTPLGNLKVALAEDNTAGLATQATLSAINTAIASLVTNTADLLADGDNSATSALQTTINTTLGTLGTQTTLAAVLSALQATLKANGPASSSATLTSVAGSATSVTLLAANSSRKTFYIYNDSTANLYIAYGATASTTAFTDKAPPNAFYEMPNNVTWTGAVSGIWDSAAGNARMTEVN